jgi:hypothetical protein
MNRQEILNRQAERTENKVKELLGMSDADFTEVFYDKAVAWLEWFTENDAPVIDCLIHYLPWWNWWRNQWRIRDRVFINRVTDERSLKFNDLEAEWNRIHDVYMVGLFPSANIIEESIKQMTSRLQNVQPQKLETHEEEVQG